jgi:photosystem II stability/assembly factor-like uncharacterized protein
MTRILAGMENSLILLESSNRGWNGRESLRGLQPMSVAVDFHNRDRSYCGTFGNGLWKSEDGGQSWQRIGKDEIRSPNVTSVSVSPLERGNNGFSIVYAGTEPSEFYRSDDDCNSWEKMVDLNNLDSSKCWSFPPRPWTHHVRWIEPDVNSSGYVFVAIEAGALVQSHDGGRTWIDRTKQGPYDTHTLSTHRYAPKRLYSSAGDGYFESYDYGESWEILVSGLRHYYLYGLAVDCKDPEDVVVSASSGPWSAHSSEDAESFIYRKSSDGERWNLVSAGLPNPAGTIITILAANPVNAGEIYALNNRGIFCSLDSGLSWKRLEIPWPKEYLLQHPWSLAILE